LARIINSTAPAESMVAREKVTIPLDFKKLVSLNEDELNKHICDIIEQNKDKLILFDATSFPLDCYGKSRLDRILVLCNEYDNLRFKSHNSFYESYKSWFHDISHILSLEGTPDEYYVKNRSS
jgi:hypothetical protein